MWQFETAWSWTRNEPLLYQLLAMDNLGWLWDRAYLRFVLLPRYPSVIQIYSNHPIFRRCEQESSYNFDVTTSVHGFSILHILYAVTI